MTRAKWTASTLILPILCVAALALAAEPYREDFDQTYNITADGRVALENVNGGVVINVWDRNAVRVQATKEADSREDLEKLRIEVDSSPSGVRIVTRMPERNEFLGRAITTTCPWSTRSPCRGGLPSTRSTWSTAASRCRA